MHVRAIRYVGVRACVRRYQYEETDSDHKGPQRGRRPATTDQAKTTTMMMTPHLPAAAGPALAFHASSGMMWVATSPSKRLLGFSAAAAARSAPGWRPRC